MRKLRYLVFSVVSAGVLAAAATGVRGRGVYLCGRPLQVRQMSGQLAKASRHVGQLINGSDQGLTKDSSSRRKRLAQMSHSRITHVFRADERLPARVVRP